ncbi:MAG: thiamine diphosphokinase [Firmicutes bacterium]|nr:thiamine diphosphokinase [Bacillota bacterium]
MGGRAGSGTCAAGRAVIIAGADIKDYSAAAALLRPDDFMIYCDSGLRHLEGLAAACGEAASPGLIIGDFDSHEKPETSAETIVLPVIKDDTDSFFAAKQAAERGFGEVLMLGCLGGRLDHTLANVSAMLWLRERGVRAFAADGLSDMEIVMPGETALVPDSYPFFSLVTIDGTAEGVSIRGAKYELEDAVIESSFQYAVSNEPLPGRTAEISLRKGRLLLIKDRS